jgi:hypothetical protein
MLRDLRHFFTQDGLELLTCQHIWLKARLALTELSMDLIFDLREHIVNQRQQVVSASKLPRRDDPLLDVELGRDNLSIFDLLSQLVRMDILLAFFVCVHAKQLELLVGDCEINQVDYLSQVGIGDET